MGKKNFKFNRHHGNPRKNHAHNQPNHQKHKVNKPKQPEPINHAIKGPLFDKSKLTCSWKLNRKIGPGFMNGQNTCFLNSVLECLTYTPALAQQMLKQEHGPRCRIEGFCALCSMEKHVVRCLKDDKSFSKGAAILPRYFTSNLRAISKTLRLGRQEDAHEFYMFLLSAIQKASVHGLGKLPPKIEETALVYQVFGGKLQSQVKCFSCKATSNNYEACLDLSVDLNKANTLQMALDNFTKTDIIGNDADNRYKCDACKQMVKAGKQMTIHELPMMLTIHLKRFAFDLQRGYMRKITTEVQFPETLDMAPYVSSEKKVKEANYQLYAVLVHFGHGCDSGHYIAYVKAPNGQWYLMDDDDVTPVSLKEVLSQRAYMLFYQQSKQSTNDDDNNVVAVPEVEVAAKKVLVLDQEPKKIKKKVNIVEPRVESDNPRAWTVQSSERPRRSLRGNLSPPTFGAHVSDDSTWAIQNYQEFKRKQKSTNRRVFRVKLEAKKTPWQVSPYRK